MMKNNLVSENFFWMPFGMLANQSAKILNGGRFLKRQFEVAAFFRFRIGCCIENCRIAFKLLPCIIPAAGLMAGKTV